MRGFENSYNKGVTNIWCNLNCFMQNGTSEEVKKIVSTLNAGQVPSEDVVGKYIQVDLLTWSSVSLFLFPMLSPTPYAWNYRMPGHRCSSMVPVKFAFFMNSL